MKATFPRGLRGAQLAGKTADFDATVKAVAAARDARDRRRVRQEPRRRDLAGALKRPCASGIGADYARASREKVKRKLLDALARAIPSKCRRGSSSRNSAQIWAQVEREQQAERPRFRRGGHDRGGGARRLPRHRRAARAAGPAARGDRRQAPDVKVTDEEMTQALIAGRAPSPARKSRSGTSTATISQALAELRAPIYEEKVVDHILGLAKVENEQGDPRRELLKRRGRRGEPAQRVKSSGLERGRRRPFRQSLPDGLSHGRRAPSAFSESETHARSRRLLLQQPRADRDRAIGARASARSTSSRACCASASSS